MAERARMANIPMPEMALKCPRCESTNTKFCYFNNYSLSQPRHFCKTCRRYWTRGGALRTVPVGGGCRRNKRSSRSKSSAPPATSSASSAGGSTGPHSSEMMPPQGLSSLRFMSSPLGHVTDFGEQLGLTNYAAADLGGDQWRNIVNVPPGLTQFPFLGDGAGSSLYSHHHHPFEGVKFSSLAIGEGEAVKVEEEMVLGRRFGNGEELEYNNWGGGNNINGWTHLSGVNNNSSSSTTSAL